MLKKVLVASDHGGFELKKRLAAHLSKKGHDVRDIGSSKSEVVDYPTIAEKACNTFLSEGQYHFGVLVCGTGVGVSIAANRFSNIRCALVFDSFTARMAKEHNDANFLSFGGRSHPNERPEDILDAYLNASFRSEPRHLRRVKRLSEIGVAGPTPTQHDL